MTTVQYLPHHAVLRKDRKMTKCHVVIDASAHEQDGVSLNHCIQLGPVLKRDLVSDKITLMADRKKIFLRMKVDEKDQDILRYLLRDLKSDELLKIYQLQPLPFCGNNYYHCSPFLAIAIVWSRAKECREEFTKAAKALSNMLMYRCMWMIA